MCRKWKKDKNSCPDQSKCFYLHREVYDPFKLPNAMPAKLQPDGVAEAKAKSKSKEKAYVAVQVPQEEQVSFNEVRHDCDYPRDDSRWSRLRDGENLHGQVAFQCL